MNILQTKAQVKNMNTIYYDLYRTNFKIVGEKEIVDNQCEKDYISFYDIIPNHNISFSPRKTTLK